MVEDPAALHAIVSELTREKEAAQPRPWAVADAPEPFVAGQLRAIIGLVLRIETLIGKRKLSQNRSAADREGATAGLAASADPRDQAVAAAMRDAAAGR
jgi:transcriptional regulator